MTCLRRSRASYCRRRAPTRRQPTRRSPASPTQNLYAFIPPAENTRPWEEQRSAGGGSALASTRARGDGRIARKAPFGPGTVINGDVGPAQEVEAEDERASGDTGAAARHHRLAALEPRSGEARGERFGRQHRPGLRIDQLVIGEIDAAGDVAAPQARPRLFRGTGEAAAGARGDHQ